ncbi:pyrroline-5-carboxylate reductase dimerization-domain-containing protein [Xylariales sp. PMI_506]|nr:pyrroline-5-carboxylate reductase dimerization-domain-containing protein [Xylariales sp. PMI_506]
MTTLCILGCGNLGIAILKSLISAQENKDAPVSFARFIACVRSDKSEQRLATEFQGEHRDRLSISRGENAKAVENSDIIILGADPADIPQVLSQPDIIKALKEKLLISVVAGWTRPKLESLLGQGGSQPFDEGRIWVIRTLPNIAAVVSQSITAIEEPDKEIPQRYLEMTNSIFNCIGRTVQVPPRLMDAFTAVGGSTPAFFAVICDALIDAAVATGVPRDMASAIIFQSMQGTATLLQSGVHPGVLKDQGTSPEGCTIGGLMVLEEAGVRGHIGRGLREAVTISRMMGSSSHVNDTRH